MPNIVPLWLNSGMTDLHWSFQVDPSAAEVTELREALVRHNIQSSQREENFLVFVQLVKNLD